MMLPYLLAFFVICGFGIAYCLLPPAMWTHYFADHKRFAFMGVIFLVLFAMTFSMMHRLPWGILGFWLMDPISYTMFMYPRILKQQEMERKNAVRDTLWPRNPPKTP